MSTKKRGPFKGHCAMCAIQRGTWRRGKREWPNDVYREAGRRRRVRRNDIPED